LLNTTEGITRLRGRWRLFEGEIAMMPTFHPAYLLRNPRAKMAVWQDLQATMRQLGLPLPQRG
jgi:DNA polymerase